MFRTERWILGLLYALLLPVVWEWGTVPLHAAEFSGRVVDARTGQPVAAATVRIEGTSLALPAGEDGTFTFDNAPEGPLELIVRHVAYRPWRRRLTASSAPVTARLEPVIVQGQGIVVTANRAVRGESPVAFENVTRREIDRAHYAQDLPVVLAESPGVYTSSDNGNGIGYSYLSVRGFPQRRVSVLINGVPLNDPESHEVYWIDLPDLAENLQDAQIQRGVGTTLYGANSIGGTVNLLTRYLSPDRQTMISSGSGSYGTRRFSAAFNSGLIDDRHTIYGRFSRIVSNGYRDNAWTDIWSYFFAAGRFDEKWTNRLNIFGGPEETHLAYKGIPRRFIDGDTSFTFNGRRPTGDPDLDRRYNPFEWKGETDNFNQPQYQLLTEFRPDSVWRLENTLYYIKGRGFYDQLRRGRDFAEYHLTPFWQPAGGTDSVKIDEAERLWRRRWVENDFWGLIPRVTRRHRLGELSAGAELNRLTASHWAQVQAVQPAPPDFLPGQRYYDYDAAKTVVSLFAQETLQPHPRLTLIGALQYAFKRYELKNNRFANAYGQKPEHQTSYSFLSPRLGITARPHAEVSFFGSVSYNELEPTNDEIFDATDYWTDAGDYFRRFDATTGIGKDPIMEPERLINYEVGAAWERPRWRMSVNLYHMRFHDEIVYNGLLNDDGVPIRANAPTSIHQGIEWTGSVDFGDGVSLSANWSLNDNTFDEFTEYIADWSSPDWPPPVDAVSRDGNPIAGFPQELGNLRLNYDHRYFGLSVRGFHAGRVYVDNSKSRAASIDPYETVDLRAEVKLEPLIGWAGLNLFCQVNNLLNEEYETSGYLDDDGTPLFIPAAKRNIYVGLRAQL